MRMHHHEISSRLKGCNLPVDARSVAVAQSLIAVNEAVDQLDIVSLASPLLKFLKLYPRIAEHTDPVKEFYKIHVLRDIDCIDDLLGTCVSPQRAKDAFINEHIDVQLVPSDQRPLLDVAKNTFVDPIDLQQHNLTNVIQLKESGELMSRTAFMDLIRHNTAVWQGKPNVGFISPMTRTIMGNLVQYNFDMAFRPQRPGTLRIERIKNSGGVPCTDKPRVIPSHYFRLTYNRYTFYLPDTAGGRHVLFIMKDCFKKGNLFAYSNDGYIRNGRIHKKTKLSATQYGYPDNTYLERVTGELTAVGSSLYTYRFSHDPWFTLAADPYPDEKRFLISYHNV